MDNRDRKVQISAQGLEALKTELGELVEKKRPTVVARLENARQQGDLSENSDYSSAKDELEFLDGRIDELKSVIENAEVVNMKAGNGSQVAFGTKVKVKVGGQESIFEIVGEWEANPLEKRISHESPLGQALMGKAVGDAVEIEAPAGKIVYQILSIE